MEYCGERVCETWQPLWSPMDSAVWILDILVGSHETGGTSLSLVTGLVDVSTAGNGYGETPRTLDQVKYLFLSVDD